MNTYYLRCRESDKDRLIALGVQLGVIALVADPDLRPQPGNPVPKGRSAQPVPDPPTAPPRVVALHGGSWDEIGYLYDDRTGNDQPSTSHPGLVVRTGKSLRSEAGQKLWHANLRTPINLRQRAQEVARTDPAVAAALAQIARYFVTRPNAPDLGAQPANPARVFA